MSHELLLSELENRISKGVDKYKKIASVLSEAFSDIELREPAPETTENYHRIRQTDPGQYERMRTIVLKPGIKAVIGFKKGGGSEVQSYLFDIDKFSMEEAKAWVKKHKDKISESVEAGKIDEAGQMSDEDVAKSSDLKKIFNELLADIDAFLSKAEGTIKGKIGSPAVRQFLREVKGKLKGMVSNIKETELKEKGEAIIDKITQFEESAMKGSFEALREKITAALEATNLFPVLNGPGAYASPWIRYTFPDKVLVSYKDKNYEVPFSVDKDVISFEKPKEVEETYVVKESSASLELKKEAKEYLPNMEFDSFVSLREAKLDNTKKEVEVILIEAGTNEIKKRHYPKATIEEAAPLFKGLKNYINHSTKEEERARPERSIKDWASTIKESWSEDGKAKGILAVHDEWLWNLLQDSVAREHIGLSINAKGKSYIGKINGKDMQIVEKICEPKSVDWVTEAGARGRVVQLMESRKEDIKMLDTVTLQELKEARPDLIEASQKESGSKPDETKLQETIDKATKPLQDQIKLRDQRDKVKDWLKESKLPEAAKKRIEVVAETLFESEAKLKEAFDARVKAEVDYLKEVNIGSGIKGLGDGEEPKTLVESMQKDLDKRAGIKEEKKEPEKK